MRHRLPTPDRPPVPDRPTRTRWSTLAAGLGLALVLVACGGDEQLDGASAAAAGDGTGATAAVEGGIDAAVDVLAGETGLGPALVGPDGRTLYGFTNDIDAISACYGTCAEAWPPVIVTDDWTAGPGLDFGIFATTVREDGQRQLVAGRWPLYFFAGDATPGDTNGQGSGAVWFAVDLDGGLIRDDAATAEPADPAEDPEGGYGSVAPPEAEDERPAGAAATPAQAAPVVAGQTDLGEVLVDGSGRTLYGFLDDRGASGSTCNGACADAWPPVIVDGDTVPAGLDPEIFSVVARDDGATQLVAGSWPLYRFAGDGGAGDTNGQGSGGVWFAASPVGSLIGAR